MIKQWQILVAFSLAFVGCQKAGPNPIAVNQTQSSETPPKAVEGSLVINGDSVSHIQLKPGQRVQLKGKVEHFLPGQKVDQSFLVIEIVKKTSKGEVVIQSASAVVSPIESDGKRDFSSTFDIPAESGKASGDFELRLKHVKGTQPILVMSTPIVIK